MLNILTTGHRYIEKKGEARGKSLLVSESPRKEANTKCIRKFGRGSGAALNTGAGVTKAI